MDLPGLVILYGSIVKKKWAVNLKALYALATALVSWVGWCYQMSFGERIFPFLGQSNAALDQKFLLRQTFPGNLLNATMVFFQFVFAAITLILIAGALLGTWENEFSCVDIVRAIVGHLLLYHLCV